MIQHELDHLDGIADPRSHHARGPRRGALRAPAPRASRERRASASPPPRPTAPTACAGSWHAGAPIGVVLTQPDRPAGRSRRPTSPPAADAAPRARPAAAAAGARRRRARRPAGGRRRARWASAPTASCCPDALLDAFPWVNLHPSALPRWRGAAPVERAILAGDTTTAAAVMAVVARARRGADRLAARRSASAPRDNAGDVMDAVARARRRRRWRPRSRRPRPASSRRRRRRPTASPTRTS